MARVKRNARRSPYADLLVGADPEHSPWEYHRRTDTKISEDVTTTLERIDAVLGRTRAEAHDGGSPKNLSLLMRLVAARLQGLDSREVAYLLGFSVKQMRQALHGDLTVQPSKEPRLTQVAGVVSSLSRTVEREHIGDWFRTPVPDLGGVTPMEAIRKRQGDRVMRIVESYLDPSYG